MPAQHSTRRTVRRSFDAVRREPRAPARRPAGFSAGRDSRVSVGGFSGETRTRSARDRRAVARAAAAQGVAARRSRTIQRPGADGAADVCSARLCRCPRRRRDASRHGSPSNCKASRRCSRSRWIQGGRRGRRRACSGSVPKLAGPWTSRFGGRDRAALRALARANDRGHARRRRSGGAGRRCARKAKDGVRLRCIAHSVRCRRRIDPTRDLTSSAAALPVSAATTAAGREVPVERIFWRVVVDDLERSDIIVAVRFARTEHRRRVDAASRTGFGYGRSTCCRSSTIRQSRAATRFLSDVTSLPEDLRERYVLKPLFSFAGGGVNVAPSAARRRSDSPPPPSGRAARRHGACKSGSTTSRASTAPDGGSGQSRDSRNVPCTARTRPSDVAPGSQLVPLDARGDGRCRLQQRYRVDGFDHRALGDRLAAARL